MRGLRRDYNPGHHALRDLLLLPGRAGPDPRRGHPRASSSRWRGRRSSGFDQIWLTEHHFIDYGLSVDPATLAAAAAARTSRVRIGLAAAILPFHDPIRLAEQLALVDIISKGPPRRRGGPGQPPGGVQGYHVPAGGEPRALRRGRGRSWCKRLDRGAVQLRRALLPIDDVRVIPKPVQRPHPPVYQVCGAPTASRAPRSRGWPMLNSILLRPRGAAREAPRQLPDRAAARPAAPRPRSPG